MDIKAFRGYRYAAAPGGDLSDFIAPPYDILSAQDKADLLARCDKNIVAVDMPHVPPKDLGPDHLYRQAAAKLADWLAQGVLRQDGRPCLYVYHQTFTWAGKTHTRSALLCGVRATEFGKDVIPHEHTFAGPKADRLRLTECTRTQLSPIFGFYNDDAGAVTSRLERVAAGEPDAVGTLRGVGEKLWAVTDEKTIAEISAALKPVPVYIADGHHRYTTQLNYRNALAAKGNLPADAEANFVLFALVARNDPGLLILPTHRMIRGLKSNFSLAALVAACPEFSWQKRPLAGADFRDADGLLRPFGVGAMAFLEAGGKDFHVALLKDKSAMKAVEPDKIEAWRDLDVAILHRLIVDKHLAAWQTPQQAIEYTPDGQAVVDTCAAGKIQLGVCLQGTPLSAVQAVANGGDVMPHKSTYFYPKLSTGIVLKPLE